MDKYHGQGGVYVLDPVTGERVPLEQPAAEPATPATPPKPRKRARSTGGRFQGDNPATPDINEAWQ
jgi:hypothetical protein